MSETKKARRQANFGKRNTVRRWSQRKFIDYSGHAFPRDHVNDNGTTWLGFSRASKRKPWRPEPSWRDWMRADGIRRWKLRRTIAELEQMEA